MGISLVCLSKGNFPKTSFNRFLLVLTTFKKNLIILTQHLQRPLAAMHFVVSLQRRHYLGSICNSKGIIFSVLSLFLDPEFWSSRVPNSRTTVYRVLFYQLERGPPFLRGPSKSCLSKGSIFVLILFRTLRVWSS